MSNVSKRSMSSTLILILLGFTALFAGEKWLLVLVPAALLVWYENRPAAGSGRN